MLARRLLQLHAGLVLYGVSAGLVLLGGLGATPWDVLHNGLANHSSIGTGLWVNIVGVFVMLLWIPLRQRPGVGTVSNVIVIGLALQLVIDLFGEAHALPEQVVLVVTGTVLNGIAGAMYIGADLGPGPRDGLMTGLAARGHSVRVVRTGIEVAVLLSGIALGGAFGVGTVFYALAIGPLVHRFLPAFTVRRRAAGTGAEPVPQAV